MGRLPLGEPLWAVAGQAGEEFPGPRPQRCRVWTAEPTWGLLAHARLRGKLFPSGQTWDLVPRNAVMSALARCCLRSTRAGTPDRWVRPDAGECATQNPNTKFSTPRRHQPALRQVPLIIPNPPRQLESDLAKHGKVERRQVCALGLREPTEERKPGAGGRGWIPGLAIVCFSDFTCKRKSRFSLFEKLP